MKSLFLTLSIVFLTTISFSQTFIFNVSEMISYRAKGNLTYNETKQNATWKSPVEPIDCSYEFDIVNRTSTFYHNGKKVNTLNFYDVTQVDSVYTIKVKDFNQSNPLETLDAVYTIDTKNMTFYLSWYVPSTGFTRAQFHTKTISKVK